MTEFTPIQSLLGGAIIGAAVVMLMSLLGRVAGLSGIAGSLLPPKPAADKGWRIAFIGGLILSAPLLFFTTGFNPAIQPVASLPLTIIGGLIVGVGVTYGAGCTSGHGICGMARISKRSIVATMTFMASTATTVYVLKHLIGA